MVVAVLMPLETLKRRKATHKERTGASAMSLTIVSSAFLVPMLAEVVRDSPVLCA